MCRSFTRALLVSTLSPIHISFLPPIHITPPSFFKPLSRPSNMNLATTWVASVSEMVWTRVYDISEHYQPAPPLYLHAPCTFHLLWCLCIWMLTTLCDQRRTARQVNIAHAKIYFPFFLQFDIVSARGLGQSIVRRHGCGREWKIAGKPAVPAYCWKQGTVLLPLWLGISVIDPKLRR